MSEKEEIEKVKRRVFRWFKRTHQINSRILIQAMKHLSKENKMRFNTLKEECKDIDTFYINFIDMAHSSNKGHGKVFEYDSFNQTIELWSPIKDFVIDEYQTYLFLKSKGTH
jgi:hypothetical protein